MLTNTVSMYLTFNLGELICSLDVLKIREIVSLIEIRTLECAPAGVSGVVNLRGRVIPVVDVKEKIGLPKAEPDKQSCIVVVQESEEISTRLVGLLVDRVDEVIEAGPDDIRFPLAAEAGTAGDLIAGVVKLGEQVIILLDIRPLFKEIGEVESGN